MRLTDSQKFTIVSLLIVAAVMTVTSVVESSFFRQAIVTSESAVMQDMVRAYVLDEESEGNLSSWDLQNYGERAAQTHLEHTFKPLTSFPGFAQIKVFNADQTIVWSDEPMFVGTRQTHHPQAVTRAIANNTVAFFNPAVPGADEVGLVEFYIPFTLGGETGSASGVLSIYRSARELDAAIWRGLRLLWLLTGVGGLVLYGALFSLFRAVSRSRHEISTKFINLSNEHERLVQMEKLSAMGQMVSEIAHQLNNPLVGVINLAELAERNLDDRARAKELLGKVRKAGEHCREFVQRVLRLSEVTRSEPQPTDLNQLVRDTIAFFQQSLGGRPPIMQQLPTEPVTLDVDPVLIRHALFNLIHNAAQADPKGPVVVSLAGEEREGGPGYALTVCDSGCGFPPELTDKLFAPFFTTRSGGTGLGLSIARHIVVVHGGAISAVNRPGGGACFTIWIPAARVSA